MPYDPLFVFEVAESVPEDPTRCECCGVEGRDVVKFHRIKGAGTGHVELCAACLWHALCAIKPFGERDWIQDCRESRDGRLENLPAWMREVYDKLTPVQQAEVRNLKAIDEVATSAALAALEKVPRRKR